MKTVHAIAIAAFLAGFAISLQRFRVGEITMLGVFLLPVVLTVAAYAASIVVIGVAGGTRVSEWPQIAKRLFSGRVGK